MEPTDDDRGITRRDFVKTLLGGVAAGIGAGRPLEAGVPPTPEAMPTRPLGQTGHAVRLFSLGGQASLEKPDTTEESLAILHRASDLGVNYIDTARIYGHGVSESHIGRVMQGRRKEVFLASKTRDRSYDGSMRSLEASLEALQTDHLDLWQVHNVMDTNDLDQIFARDGAIRALEKAREQKLVRFFGITGHYDPAILRQGIERYRFDTVLVALNAADRARASFIDQLLPVAVEKHMGVIGMKIPARGRLLRADGVASMKDALRYVLTLPVSTVIVGISTLAELEENVRIAREFQPMEAMAMRRLEDLARPYAEEAAFFKMPT